jgi:hypothetical protein
MRNPVEEKKNPTGKPLICFHLSGATFTNQAVTNPQLVVHPAPLKGDLKVKNLPTGACGVVRIFLDTSKDMPEPSTAMRDVATDGTDGTDILTYSVSDPAADLQTVNVDLVSEDPCNPPATGRR